MSYENFDYDKALNSIKATLFDIYEAQERLVGSIEDDGKRQTQINKYIKMKDTAINLIEDVENLTNDQIVRNVVNEQEQTKNEENVDSEPKLVEINLNSKTDELLKESDNQPVDEVPVEESVEEIDKEATNDEPNTNIDTDTDTFEEDTTEQINSNTETIENDDNSVELPKEEKQEISNESDDSQEEQIEEEKQSENEEVKEEAISKFYLDDRNGTKPNFAFVPKELYSVIKKNGIFELNLNAKEEINDAKDDRIHKTDENKPKGIIVRNDQFMKLALSKRRQEGVLADAKIFRVEQAKASRKKMLEEEEKKLDIKTKNLKLAI